jgi:hypothetical protein
MTKRALLAAGDIDDSGNTGVFSPGKISGRKKQLRTGMTNPFCPGLN